MAYNNYYPTYYNPYPPLYNNFNSNGNNINSPINSSNSGSQTTTNSNPNNFAWVQGVNGAKSYMVGAGNSAILLDSEDSVFYIKTVDQSGMPLPLRTFRYVEEKETEQKETVTNDIDFNKFVTKDELQAELKKITETKTAKTVKKGEDNG